MPMKYCQAERPNYGVMNIVCFYFGKKKTPAYAHISTGVEKLVDISDWEWLFFTLFHLWQALLLCGFLKTKQN